MGIYFTLGVIIRYDFIDLAEYPMKEHDCLGLVCVCWFRSESSSHSYAPRRAPPQRSHSECISIPHRLSECVPPAPHCTKRWL